MNKIASLVSTLGLLTTIVAASSAFERTAEACGGCFVPPGPSTQVSAHRMAFAVSTRRTILWDQVEYVGNPSSFGWVLPIRGKVDVGVSSDQLFQRLEALTAPNIVAPPRPSCGPQEHKCKSCDGLRQDDPAAFASAGTEADTGVTVWSSNVVGPYEATQLGATDAGALEKWLADHGYVLPTSISPIVAQYVKEGFGFLAIKLVPNADVRSMVPIRIAFDGSSPTLPLRMVAAGTGAEVGIKLWVIGEGRWEAKNFANAEVKTSDLVWDFNYGGSNFPALEQQIVASHSAGAWITETSDQLAEASAFAGLPPGTTSGDAGTDAGPVFASDTDDVEVDRAFPGKPLLTITRMFAQLPAASLANDLEVQASLGGKIAQTRTPPSSINGCPGPVYECCGGGPISCATTPSSPSSTTSGSSSSLRWVGLAALGAIAVGVGRRRALGR